MAKVLPLNVDRLRSVLPSTSSKYLLTGRALWAGVILGAGSGFFSGNMLIGYAFFALSAAIGLTWSIDEAPVFPFVIGVQWVQITSGYFFEWITGIMPSTVAVGNIDRTVGIALTGLIVLAAGIRAVAEFEPAPTADEPRVYVRNLTGLLWLVIGLYSINYVLPVNTMVSGGLNQFFQALLVARQVPLLLLWFEVIRQRRHKIYLWISLFWVFVPALGAYLSDFKTPLFLALIVSASAWKPWESHWWRFTLAGATRTTAIVVAAIFLALVWQGGVKGETRQAYADDAIGSSPRERVEFFVDSAERTIPTIFNDTEFVVEGLVSRIWYVVFFSRVLDYVPTVEPFAHGELLEMAVTNAVTPRFLFPDKPPLPSDSYYTRRFAGVDIIDREDTSISIGYMAEFYSDWGLPGMVVSIFFYGVLMGGIALIIRRFTSFGMLFNPTLITVLLTVSFFEQQFIKMLGGLMISTITTLLVVWLTRQRLERFLDLRPVQFGQSFGPPQLVQPIYPAPLGGARKRAL